MDSSLKFLFLRCTQPLLALLILLHIPVAHSGAQPTTSIEPQKTLKVLVLYSFHKDMPWNVGFEKGINAGVKNLPANVKLYHEYLDASRFPIGKNPAFVEFLKNRYAEHGIDYVVAVSEAAASFLSTNPDFIPGAKYVSVDQGTKYTESKVEIDGNHILIGVGYDYPSAIRAMMKTTPSKIERLYVVADTQESGGPNRLGLFQQALKDTGISMPVEFLINLSMEEYKSKLSKLPDNSAIYYLLLFSDPATGKNFTPYRAVSTLSSVANAPVFSYWDTLMGSGIVGGYLVSSEKLGMLSARTIGALENGTPPTLEPDDGYNYLYDWRQLKRWGINESLLSEKSEIRHVEPGIWEIYHHEILSVVITFVLLLISIAILQYQVKRKTRHLLIAQENAKRANEIKAEFLSVMSHELNTPLNIIMGMSELALMNTENPKQKNNIQKAYDASKAMYELVKNILDYLSTDETENRYKMTLFHFRKFIKDFDEAARIKAKNNGLSLSTLLEPNIPSDAIGDPTHLGQVLELLVDNAIKFNRPGGSIDINVSMDTEEAGHFQLHFAVKDSGIGINPEDQEKIFRAFSQADGSITRKYGGVGLGLALASKLVTKMSGNIWVESEPGAGTTFHFTLQFGKSPAERLPKQA